MLLKVKKLNEAAVLPQYAHEGDSGFDLVAVKEVVIEAGETKKVPIGLAFDIPQGYELQIRPRSGITSKTELRVQLGTVDSGYKGEISAIVDNIANSMIGSSATVRIGDRIAQGVIAPVIRATIQESDDVGSSERGTNGFGSTGVKA